MIEKDAPAPRLFPLATTICHVRKWESIPVVTCQPPTYHGLGLSRMLVICLINFVESSLNYPFLNE